MRDNDIGNGVAQGKFFIFGEFLENLCGCGPDRSVVLNNMKRRLYFIQEFNCCFEIRSVTEKRYGFAYNVPCGIKHNGIVQAIFKQFACSFKIGVIGA
jgi:hypothetical protein